jgi:mono/diheme cytochrome c family protein
MQQPIDQRSMKQPNEAAIKSPRTRRRARSVALLSALLLAVCIGPVLAQEPAGKDLRTFYQQNCAGCHGPDGSAVGAEGKKLRGQDFTDPDWLNVTRDDEMVKTILKGKLFGLAMPSFEGKLTGDEIKQMVTDIVRKCKKGQMIALNAERPVKKKE